MSAPSISLFATSHLGFLHTGRRLGVSQSLTIYDVNLHKSQSLYREIVRVKIPGVLILVVFTIFLVSLTAFRAVVV